ncbi:MAG: PKD domain-containing protein [Candidatus Parcubacteria bacterium]|nr:PKD domain-containing protein [Candidatus Parcubacteria bacterium]
MFQRVVVAVLIGAAVLFIASCATLDKEPVASFEVPGVEIIGQVYQVEKGAKVDFDASDSSDSDGTIALYKWDFGDGFGEGTGSSQTSHTFVQVGTYWVTLQVVDDWGHPSCASCMARKFVVGDSTPPPLGPCDVLPVVGLGYFAEPLDEGENIFTVTSAYDSTTSHTSGYHPEDLDWLTVEFTKGDVSISFNSEQGEISANGQVSPILTEGTWTVAVRGKNHCSTKEMIATASRTFRVGADEPPPPPTCVDPVITELKVDGQQLSSSVIPEKPLFAIVTISVKARDSDSCLPCSGSAPQDGIESIQVTVKKPDGSVADTRTFNASSGSFTLSACAAGLWTIQVFAYDDDCQQRMDDFSGSFRVVDSTPPPPTCVDPVITELRVDGQQLSSLVVPEKELFDIVTIAVSASDSDTCVPCSGSAKQNGITSVQVTVWKPGGIVSETRTFSASSGSFTLSACEVGLWTIEVVAYDDDCQQRMDDFSGSFRVVDSTPPPPPPDPCDTAPVLDAKLTSSQPIPGQVTVGTTMSIQVIAYQPPDQSSGYHSSSMARIQVSLESPTGNFQAFDTKTGTLPVSGVVGITPNELGTWIIRGYCWNLCQECPLTDEFYYVVEVVAP